MCFPCVEVPQAAVPLIVWTANHFPLDLLAWRRWPWTGIAIVARLRAASRARELIRAPLSAIVKEMSSPNRRKLWARLGIVLGIWTALAVFLTGQAYLIVYSTIKAHADLPHTRPSLALGSLAECLIWAFLTLGILWLSITVSTTQKR